MAIWFLPSTISVAVVGVPAGAIGASAFFAGAMAEENKPCAGSVVLLTKSPSATDTPKRNFLELANIIDSNCLKTKIRALPTKSRAKGQKHLALYHHMIAGYERMNHTNRPIKSQIQSKLCLDTEVAGAVDRLGTHPKPISGIYTYCKNTLRIMHLT